MNRALIVSLFVALTLTACAFAGSRYRMAVDAWSLLLDMKNQTTSDSGSVQPPNTANTVQGCDQFLAKFAAQSNRKSYKLMKKLRDQIAAGEKWGVVRQTMEEAKHAADGGD